MGIIQTVILIGFAQEYLGWGNWLWFLFLASIMSRSLAILKANRNDL